MMQGQCLCGAVTVTLAQRPAQYGACYCDMCRRWSGGRWVGAWVRDEAVTLTGKDAVTVVATSDWAERAFCNTCGSSLWYRVTDGAYADAGRSLSIGLFDNTDIGDAPLANIYYSDKQTCAYAYENGPRQMTEAEVLALFAPAEEGEPE